MKKLFPLLLLFAACSTPKPATNRAADSATLNPSQEWEILRQLYPEYTDSDIKAVVEGCTLYRADSSATAYPLPFTDGHLIP